MIWEKYRWRLIVAGIFLWACFYGEAFMNKVLFYGSDPAGKKKAVRAMRKSLCITSAATTMFISSKNCD